MLHENTPTSIGLEDISILQRFMNYWMKSKTQYKEKLLAGEVDLERDKYGCNGQYSIRDGSVGSVVSSAVNLLEEDLNGTMF